jgi:DNA-binding LytR/AlgR family response regulator
LTDAGGYDPIMVGAGLPAAAAPLTALVVDDEAPARGELAWLLDADPRVGCVRAVDGGAEALRALETRRFDVVFCDILMPDLDGLDLARVLARFAEPPQVVFVTAHESHAVEAFELRATDYLLKPVRPERLAEAVRRVAAATRPPGRPRDRGAGWESRPAQQPGAPGGPGAPGALADSGSPGAGGPWAGEAEPPADETFPVELGGVTRFVHRSEVRFVVAQGDYVRLYTATGAHLVRTSLTTLEERWGGAGFVRIHRSTLVALAFVDELRMDDGRCMVRLGDRMLPVSRRHTRALRDRLVRAASLTRGAGRLG